jgi:hypothetical protein
VGVCFAYALSPRQRCHLTSTSENILNTLWQRLICQTLLEMQMLLIRYMLDAMHCEMNLAKNFLKTIVGSKDTVKVRRDLQ